MHPGVIGLTQIWPGGETVICLAGSSSDSAYSAFQYHKTDLSQANPQPRVYTAHVR